MHQVPTMNCRSFCFLLLLNATGIAVARRSCGGVFTAPRGILQTPNFPGPFPDAECEWVINSSAFPDNVSIVVYLTQVFGYDGLTFTQYQLYGDGFKVMPGHVLTVNETNISQLNYIQAFQRYLVIRFKRENSAHLRVLDRFLDVYGFNITYEITAKPVKSNICTTNECGFTGNCYTDFEKFFCDCFEGYSGPYCSSGPKSICSSGGKPVCKNGATCVHVGVSAIKCHCTSDFTGHTCEQPISTEKYCENCRSMCSFNPQTENPCQCPKRRMENSNQFDRVLYSTKVHVSNLPKLDPEKLKGYIKMQFLRFGRLNSSKIEEFNVDNVQDFMSGTVATIYFYGLKKDEKKLRLFWNKIALNGYIGNLTISEPEITLQTMSLESFTVDRQGLIRENEDILLSCVIRGPQNIKIRWYKDGYIINASTKTTKSNKWTKIIKDDGKDQYIAVLGISPVEKLDQGVFTCQLYDFNVQQCMSQRIVVASPPRIKLEPLSMTVKKGENFTIKCMTEEDDGKKFNYIWVKNNEMLPISTDTEKYEILYPSGSILFIFNAEKDVQYSCRVAGEFSASERSIKVHVIDKVGVETCRPDHALGFSWPETAPDTNSIQDCPKGYNGTVVRSCILRDGKKPAWNLPNFADCAHHQLLATYQKFELFKLDYLTDTLEDILQGFLNYLTSIKALFPGEGAKILSMTAEVLSYINQIQTSSLNVTKTTYSIIDQILIRNNSLLTQSHVQLVESILNILSNNYSNLIKNHPTFNLNLDTVYLTVMDLLESESVFQIPVRETSVAEWCKVQLTGRISGKRLKKSPQVISSVVFKNLSEFLPPRSFLRAKDGSEVEYEILSQVLSVWTSGDLQGLQSVKIDFQHMRSVNGNWSNFDGWIIQCASAETFYHAWDIYSCKTTPLGDSATQCICPLAKSYALLLTSTPLKMKSSEEEDPRRYILVGGCSLCMALALFTSACLATSCWMIRCSCLIFLKLQCSLSVFGSTLLFTLATITGPQPDYYPYFITSLETFLLLGMSSHLSKLLIVFSELVHLPKPVTSKQTVIGIVSGVPILTVFGTHLAYRTMNLRLNSWWMVYNSLAFNVFATVTGVISLLFIFIYITVMNKLRELEKRHDKHMKGIQKRTALLKRSCCLFISILSLSVSSIIYINTPHSIWSLYQFSTVSSILGFVLLGCYVIKAETEFHNLFNNKNKLNKDDKFFSMDSTSSPLNFFMKQEGEVENDSVSQVQPDIHRSNSKNSEYHCMMDSAMKSSSSVTAYDDCNSTSFYEPQVSTPKRKTDNLENYCSSPQQFRKYPVSHSPDILASKTYAELDLVASVQNTIASNNSSPQPVQKSFPKLIVTPVVSITSDEGVSKSLENKFEGYQERTQPDGIEKTLEVEKRERRIFEQNSSCKDNLDGMLDSISHDLDYLLNRNDEVVAETLIVNTSSLRRISRPPSLSVQLIKEEEIEDDEGLTKSPETITSGLRTSC